jgi:hypothetical protein
VRYAGFRGDCLRIYRVTQLFANNHYLLTNANVWNIGQIDASVLKRRARNDWHAPPAH